MKTIAGCLVAALLALTVRVLLDGLTFGGGLAGAALVVLLLTLWTAAPRPPWNRPSARRAPRMGRARIGIVDPLGISEYEIDGGITVLFFARAYTDDRGSAAAYERGQAKISKRENTSLFGVRAPDGGRKMLFVLRGTLVDAKRARERVSWGAVEYQPTPDEIAAIATCFREVAQADALSSAASWGGARGLGLGREGSRGPIRRPQG